MTTYRERLTAPLSWWLAAVAFGVIWAWILLVVSTWPIAIITGIVVAIPGLVAVWMYGALLVTVDGDGLHVGRASLGPAHLGTASPLHRVDYRHQLGVGADARAQLFTRPYVDRGVMVEVTDDKDPAPYWLISSRHPEALAAALGHTEEASAPSTHETIGESSRGEEDQAH